MLLSNTFPEKSLWPTPPSYPSHCGLGGEGVNDPKEVAAPALGGEGVNDPVEAEGGSGEESDKAKQED